MKVSPLLISVLAILSITMGYMIYPHFIIERYNSTVVNHEQLVFNQSNGAAYLGNELYSGVSMSYYSDGTQKARTSYISGKKHGKATKWFDNGVISYEAYFKNGRPNGISRSWWKNGKLRTKSNYKQGIAEGTQFQFYRSGALFKKINLIDGRESGIQQSWRENGKLYNNYEVVNGRIYGLKRAKLCFQLDNENIKA